MREQLRRSRSRRKRFERIRKYRLDAPRSTSGESARSGRRLTWMDPAPVTGLCNRNAFSQTASARSRGSRAPGITQSQGRLFGPVTSGESGSTDRKAAEDSNVRPLVWIEGMTDWASRTGARTGIFK